MEVSAILLVCVFEVPSMLVSPLINVSCGTVPVVIYHDRCLDGYLSAWCFWRRFGIRCELIAASHGDVPPELSDRVVFIADFCYPRDELLALAARARHVTVLDHHVTTKKSLHGIATDAKLSILIDVNRSGSGISWDALFPGASRPALIDAMDDHDTGRDLRPESAALVALLSLEEFQFSAYDSFVNFVQQHPEQALRDGEFLRRREAAEVRRMLPCTRWLNIGHERVPVVGCAPWIATRISDELRSTHGVQFAATYVDEADGRRFSLRSEVGGPCDVGRIAEGYGGGGHRSMAGFRVERNHPLARA